MIQRSIYKKLKEWQKKLGRKPLVLRGARQTGKTTLIKDFGQEFEQFIYLNLELPEDRVPFEQFTNIEMLIQHIFFIKNKLIAKRSSTLLFIDEIQETPEALNTLRYFYEDAADIAVVAAGSMLETALDRDISFPVGRVEYMVLRPLSFEEFLQATHEKTALKAYKNAPLNNFTSAKLFTLFHTYALIGGMPEIVVQYLKNKDITSLGPIYDSLIQSYLEDVEKYAGNTSQASHIKHIINNSFLQAGKRITFDGFGNSTYRSREISEAFKIVEKALLLKLVFPVTSAQLPLMPDIKKSPKLQVLDSGLLNYFAGIQKEIINTVDLQSVYQGTLIEHLVGQELLVNQYQSLSSLYFWVRDKSSSSAEVDYIYPFEGKLIPIEVKSGKSGKLKSLHQYMEKAPHTLAIRLYAGEISMEEVTTPGGKVFKLLNLPYFLAAQIPAYLNLLFNEE